MDWEQRELGLLDPVKEAAIEPTASNVLPSLPYPMSRDKGTHQHNPSRRLSLHPSGQ